MIKRLDTVVPKLMERNKVPGFALSFISDNKISSIHTFGYANKEKKQPITENTVFQIASISKSVAAWGIMKLVESGVIDFDAPVEKYLTRWHLPSSEYDNDEVTIKRVLSNSAGLSFEGYAGTNPKYDYNSIEETLSGIMAGPFDDHQMKYLKKWNLSPDKEKKSVRVIKQPGKKFMYSGGGFSILQLIIEEVTNQTFADFMKKEILNPLGMKLSTFIPSKDFFGYATGYDEDAEPLPFYKFVALAAGGLYSTIHELTIFALAGMEGPNGELPGRGILKPETVEQMYTKVIPAGDDFGFDWYYGLGHYITETNGIKVIQHSGGHIGWRSMMIILPELGSGLIMLTNSSAGNPVWASLMGRWSRIVLKGA